MAPGTQSNMIGVIAIVVGGLLALGGLLFLLLTFLSDVPQVIRIPPVVQIGLGLLQASC